MIVGQAHRAHKSAPAWITLEVSEERIAPEADQARVALPMRSLQPLERAYAEHDPGLTQLLGTPFILNYKDDPRFAAFCQKLKLPVPTTAATKP